MYFPYFITYMLLGFAISLVVFFWALKNGQFKDQQRARFLPLEEDSQIPGTRISTFNRYEAYILLSLAIAGLAASAAVLIFALLNGKYF
jgi:cbb3-type cytochrome oxidase maturation protein